MPLKSGYPSPAVRLAVVIFALVSPTLFAAETSTYAIDLTAGPKPVQRDHLDLGGSAPGGGKIAVNSYFIEKDGQPFFPIVGEFHYCRYPAAYWEESLQKIKAGGVNVVATYIFWNLHERTEGQFDWSGDLDLRRFVEIAGRCGLSVIVRIGPFGHGEMRNGGLPDWIYGRDFEVRSNDAGYLGYVDKLYTAISRQLGGLFYKEGGPIIGIQLENEFQHSAAPWEINYPGAPKEYTVADRDIGVTHGGVSVSEIQNKNSGYGSDHMANLKLIAKRHGLEAPIYTATGWGNASIVPKGSIPVTAAYPYPFWTPKAEPSPFYLFKDIHAKPDYLPVSYEPELYPSIPAELGAGIEPIYSRRPYVPEESIEPMIVRVLGSGSNGIGYYMYHGGATPVFDRFYNEEASGVPKINYDYQSPLGQYGQVREHFRTLRLLHLFLGSYGRKLAPLPSVLPKTNAEITAGNTDTLRFAARAAEGAGFLFLLNFQDHAQTQDLGPLRLQINDGRQTLAVPSTGTFVLKRDACAILPINLDLDGVRLQTATVQPLSIRRVDGRNHFVFFSIDGLLPELVFAGGDITALQNCRGERAGTVTRVVGEAGACFSFAVDGKPVLVIPRRLALDAAEREDGRLLFAGATLLAGGEKETVLSAGKSEVDVAVYPALAAQPGIAGATLETIPAPSPTMSAFRVKFKPITFAAKVRQITQKKYAVSFSGDLKGLNDVFMRVNYLGDTGMAFVEGKMIDDHFYFGRPWDIGLKRFIGRRAETEMVFVLHPIRRDATFLGDIPEEFRPTFAAGQESRLEFRGVEFMPEYKAILTFR